MRFLRTLAALGVVVHAAALDEKSTPTASQGPVQTNNENAVPPADLTTIPTAGIATFSSPFPVYTAAPTTSLHPVHGLVRVQSQFGGEMSIECDHCCTTIITKTTLVETIITETETQTQTETATVTETETQPTTIYTTEYDVTTEVQYTTDFVTETLTTTFATSYPVTVTTLTTCNYPGGEYTPPYPTPYPTPYPGAESIDALNDQYCGTITVTQYTTTTTTSIFTSVTTAVVTGPGKTVTKPGQTVTKPGQTITEPGQTVTEPPTTIIEPGTTITQPGRTITQPGRTVTAPGTVTTITQPGTTRTLPASTVTSTITEVRPAVTQTITKVNGVTVTSTLPGSTVTRTTIVTLGPSTVTSPDQTITVTPIFSVTLCPKPTGSSAPLAPESDRTFGCAPGYVCNPPKPGYCNFWPGLPSDDFLCNPEDCMPAPPFVNVTWPPGETDYYPPTNGYFDLDPEAFGLSYDIFEYSVCDTVVDGHTSHLTTGNWVSQTSLSLWPLPSTQTADAQHTNRMGPWGPSHKGWGGQSDRRRSLKLQKRVDPDTTTPAVCFDECNDANHIAQSLGKSDKLCEDGSAFRNSYNSCKQCIIDNADSTKNTPRQYVEPSFAQYLGYCDSKPPTSVSSGGPDPIVSGTPTVVTNSQVQASATSVEPISSSTELSETVSSSSVSSSSVPSVPSSTDVVTTTQPPPETTETEAPTTTEQPPETTETEAPTTTEPPPETTQNEEPATTEQPPIEPGVTTSQGDNGGTPTQSSTEAEPSASSPPPPAATGSASVLSSSATLTTMFCVVMAVLLA